MEKIKSLFLVLSIFSFAIYGQEKENVNTNTDVNWYMANSSSGQIPVVPANNKDIDGDYYLFDTWNNHSLIYSGSKGVKLSNSNYNLWKDAIEFKTSADSVYTISSSSIDSLTINNKLFKKLPSDREDYSKFSEILLSENNLIFYKRYSSKIDKSKMNPITGAYDFPDKVEISSHYYISIDGNVKELDLRKRDILKLFSSNEDDVKSFVKNQDLSYREETDVKKIIKHFSNTIL